MAGHCGSQVAEVFHLQTGDTLSSCSLSGDCSDLGTLLECTAQPGRRLHTTRCNLFVAVCCVVFGATEFSGEPLETEEMAPVWVPVTEIPYDRMWADDLYWYPLFLQGSCFEGLFAFTNTHTMVWHKLRELQDTKQRAPAETLCNA